MVRDAEQMRRDALRAKFGPRPLPSSAPVNLPLRDVVHLCALINVAANESFEWMTPIERVTNLLGPNEDYTNQVLTSLRGAGIIEIHGGSDLSAFEWNDGFPESYYMQKVFWTVGRNATEAKEFFRRSESALRSRSWPQHWLDELPGFVEELLILEALQYLRYVTEEHNMPFTAGDKTKLILSATLNDFPLGELYNLIWRQAKDAAAYYQRKRVPIQQAANSIPGGIQRAADYARAQGWTIKSFSRNMNVPQSAVSRTLFDTALQLGERLYSITLDEVRTLADQSSRHTRELLDKLHAVLAEPRQTGRTAMHTILLQSQVQSPTLDELSEMVEEVTMGEVDWDDFVLDARAALRGILLPRYL